MELVKKRKRNKKNSNYINNKDFTLVIKQWVEENKGKKNRKDWTKMPEYIGNCLIKLAENYANKNCFRGYSYLDEMKSEAILTCIKYAHNFDFEKSNNAFAYFTSIIHKSFIQILNKEKIQSEIKYKKISEESPYNYENINLYEEEV